MNYGKLYNEPLAEYHGGDCISATRLSLFRRSPLLYKKLFIEKSLPKPEKTEALILGQAIDTLALSGIAAFKQEFICAPLDAPRRPTSAQLNAKKPSPDSIAAIEFWRSFEIAHADKTMLTQAQMNTVNNCCDSLNSFAPFLEAKQAGRAQVTFRVHGAKFDSQCRPDLWLEEGCGFTSGEPAIVDLKTIVELPQDDDQFLPRHMVKFGYHRSAYFYREIVAQVMKYLIPEFRPNFYLLFVEKDEPFACSLRKVGPRALAAGEREVSDALRAYIECIESGIWESREEPGTEIDVPAWYGKREEFV